MASEIAAVAKAADSPAGSTLLKILGSALPNPLIEPFRERMAARDMRNKIDSAVGDAVARRMAEDPDVVERAQARLIGQFVAAQTNVEAVAEVALEHGALNGDDAKQPEDDWINYFVPYAEKASSDRMRDLLGRILAGEVKRPGSYSLSTLRILNELSQQQAENFLWFWSHSIGEVVPTTIMPGPGIEWIKITQLRDTGLVTPVDSAIWQPESTVNSVNNMPWTLGKHTTFLSIWTKGPRHFVNVYRLTAVGEEIATLIDDPKYEDNLRKLAVQFYQKSTRIELRGVGDGPELIYDTI